MEAASKAAGRQLNVADPSVAGTSPFVEAASKAAGRRFNSSHRSWFSSTTNEDPEAQRPKWESLKKQGVELNPCKSPHHPAVIAGVVAVDPSAAPECVQEAYTPASKCYGCGPAAPPDALHLKSYRIPGGLEAKLQIATKYLAFPGIVNGGVISMAFACHGESNLMVVCYTYPRETALILMH